jgi:quercetin dioxygenase-like cupin family protein
LKRSPATAEKCSDAFDAFEIVAEPKEKGDAMTTSAPAPKAGRLFHRPVATGRAYWGPGDHYTFLVTGKESGGAYFVMEALVPPGGGPPLHIHHREDETYYMLKGQIEVTLGEETIVAGPNDFVNFPRGAVPRVCNPGTESARMVLTFTPAGIEGWFEETLERAPNEVQEAPDNIDEVVARYVAEAPRYGIEFV